MNARLRQLDAEKNFFLGMAAHDLRNPIGNIQTLAQLLKEEASERLSADEQTYLAMIATASKGMIDLLNNILDITKIESGQVSAQCEELNLMGLLQECISNHKVAADAKDIHLSYSLRNEHLRVKANRTQFMQILNNLVSNAIKYSHRKTEVEITAEMTIEGEMAIKIIDQGQGIPDDEQCKLFQPFTRTSVATTSGESSNGLGLCIVKRLVEGHGGRIWVDSKSGLGSTFAFTVKTAEEQVQPKLKTA
jgi:signal transduction histidine kinase